MDLTSAPWWGVPVIAGAFLVIGALLAFLSNWLLESRKAKRERAERWDQDVRRHTSAVVGLARQLEQRARDFESAQQVATEIAVDQMKRGEPVGMPDVAMPALRIRSDVFELLTAESDSLAIVAPSPVRARALKVQGSATLLMTAKDEYDVDEGITHLRNDVSALEQAVRAHFGIR